MGCSQHTCTNSLLPGHTGRTRGPYPQAPPPHTGTPRGWVGSGPRKDRVWRSRSVDPKISIEIFEQVSMDPSRSTQGAGPGAKQAAGGSTSTTPPRRWRHVPSLQQPSLDVSRPRPQHRKQQPPRVVSERENRSWEEPTYVRETPRGQHKRATRRRRGRESGRNVRTPSPESKDALTKRTSFLPFRVRGGAEPTLRARRTYV